MTVYVVSHDDLDGLLSAALIKRKFGKQVKIKISSYIGFLESLRAVSNSIKENDELYITDLRLTSDVQEIIALLQSLIAKGIMIHYFDHHGNETAGNLRDVNIDKEIVDKDANLCCTELTYEKLGIKGDDYAALLARAAHIVDYKSDIRNKECPINIRNFAAKYDKLVTAVSAIKHITDKTSKLAEIANALAEKEPDYDELLSEYAKLEQIESELIKDRSLHEVLDWRIGSKSIRVCFAFSDFFDSADICKKLVELNDKSINLYVGIKVGDFKFSFRNNSKFEGEHLNIVSLCDILKKRYGLNSGGNNDAGGSSINNFKFRNDNEFIIKSFNTVKEILKAALESLMKSVSGKTLKIESIVR